MRKGQIFTTDFVVSFVIFLAVMGIGFTALNEATQEQLRFSRYNMMQRQAQQVAGLLVRTPGYPADWNSSTVRVVGFASPDHMLQWRKLAAFEDLGSYRRQRQALDIYRSEFLLKILSNGSIVEVKQGGGGGDLGDEPVAYIVQEGSSFAGNELLEVLNSSTLTWDLYWPSTKNSENLTALTARHVYNYTTSGSEMFDDMAINASQGSYATILAEHPNQDVGSLENESSLREFVADGGTYLQAEEKPELLRDLFHFKEVSVGSGNGSVVQVEPLLNSSYDVGDYIQFQDEPMAFKNVTTYFVNDTQDPHGCLACMKEFKSGKVYYAADVLSEAGTATGFTDADQAFQGNLTLRFGRPVPDDATYVVVSRRSVLLNTTRTVRRGELRVVLWN